MDIYSSDEDIDLAIAARIRNQRKARQFQPRKFEEEIDDKTFRERYRVPRNVLDQLEEILTDKLKHNTHRNCSLQPRDQIKIFLHFIGTSAFYHILRDCHGVSTETVHRAVHSVCDALFDLRENYIHWPENPQHLANKFYEVAGMPSVCGLIDGSHILITPPAADEDAFINRHQDHSLNVLAVCGPDLKIYYANSRAPGRWHDSRVLRESALWEEFEVRGQRIFPGAVLLGDAGYPNNDWIITPFIGQLDRTKEKFNTAHTKTRNGIERCFGVLKHRFYALQNRIRFQSLDQASKLVHCACILHNMCIAENDDGSDLPEVGAHNQDHNFQIVQDPPVNLGQADRRRQQILQHFA
jgi:nuclease HARBI1